MLEKVWLFSIESEAKMSLHKWCHQVCVRVWMGRMKRQPEFRKIRRVPEQFFHISFHHLARSTPFDLFVVSCIWQQNSYPPVNSLYIYWHPILAPSTPETTGQKNSAFSAVFSCSKKETDMDGNTHPDPAHVCLCVFVCVRDSLFGDIPRQPQNTAVLCLASTQRYSRAHKRTHTTRDAKFRHSLQCKMSYYWSELTVRADEITSVMTFWHARYFQSHQPPPPTNNNNNDGSIAAGAAVAAVSHKASGNKTEHTHREKEKRIIDDTVWHTGHSVLLILSVAHMYTTRCIHTMSGITDYIQIFARYLWKTSVRCFPQFSSLRRRRELRRTTEIFSLAWCFSSAKNSDNASFFCFLCVSKTPYCFFFV